MNKSLILITLSVLALTTAYCQAQNQTAVNSAQTTEHYYKYSVCTPFYSFDNFGKEKTNTHHYELHFGYRQSPKDKFGIKIATWKLFAPMGMPMAEQLKFDEDNFYPGRLRESGIGVTYQRKIWKGLFVATEIMPQLKTYLDEDNKKVGDGFKLYTSYHLGYHVSLFKDRFYLEPQIHCQYWPIDTNVPQAFKDKDDEWNNYFLFEPDLYLGVNFEY